MRLTIVAATVVAACCGAGAGAQVLEDRPLPSGGQAIIASGRDPFAGASGRWGEADVAGFEAVALEGEPYDRAARVRTLRTAAGSGAVDLCYYSTAAVAKGDALLVTFVARGEGTMGRQAQIEARVDRGSGGWESFGERVVGLQPRWQRFYVPMTAPVDYPAGQSRLSLRMGFDPQTVEVADAAVINYRKSIAVADLPRTVVTYAGREADAPWRAAAQQRIERHRKADLVVEVRDAAGAPVAGADVHVRLVRHAFPFGTAVSTLTLIDPANERYREMVDRHFDHVTIEWETNWSNWLEDRARATSGIEWLRARGKRIDGCHIIWPGKSNLPPHVVALADRPDELRAALLAHIDDKVGALKGVVGEWNAINEPTSNRFVEETLGREALVEIFRHAKHVDPSARLAVNDYADIANPSEAMIEQYLEFIADLKRRGAPIDAVGLQGHFGSFLRSPDELHALLDRFAELGYPLRVTELDVNVPDEAAQADYTRDLLTVLFAHPAVERVTLWGFWEGRHWIPPAALWRSDWSIKPNGQAYVDLVTKAWTTDEWLTTDASGRAATRAFLGEHELVVTHGGKRTTTSVTLTQDSSPIVVRVE